MDFNNEVTAWKWKLEMGVVIDRIVQILGHMVTDPGLREELMMAMRKGEIAGGRLSLVFGSRST